MKVKLTQVVNFCIVDNVQAVRHFAADNNASWDGSNCMELWDAVSFLLIAIMVSTEKLKCNVLSVSSAAIMSIFFK